MGTGYSGAKNKIFKIKLKKGDNVIVRSGKYKGKIGNVIATHPRLNAVTVEGVNVVKKHQKPNKTHPQGGIIEKVRPIAVSKVGINVNGKPSRIGYMVGKDNVKVRVAKKSGKELK